MSDATEHRVVYVAAHPRQPERHTHAVEMFNPETGRWFELWKTSSFSDAKRWADIRTGNQKRVVEL